MGTMAAQVTVRNKLNGNITTVSEKVLNNSRLAEVLEVVECETGHKVVVESGASENPESTVYEPPEDYVNTYDYRIPDYQEDNLG